MYDGKREVPRRTNTHDKGTREALRVPRKDFAGIVEAKEVEHTFPGGTAMGPELGKLLKDFQARCVHPRVDHSTRQLLGSSAEFPVKKSGIFAFVRSWLRRFLPAGLLGTANLKRYLDNLKFFLGAGKGCRTTLGTLMRKLDPEECGWAAEDPTASPTWLAKVVVFLTEDIVWQMLLRAMFHISDSSWGRNELHFYRRRQWQSVVDRAAASLVSVGDLRPLGGVAAARLSAEDAAPTPCIARLLPKVLLNWSHNPLCNFPHFSFCGQVNGSRLVARRMTCGTDDDKDTKLIDEAKILLKKLRDRHPEVVDIHGRALHSAWAKLNKRAEGRKVHFACVDIRRAFDTVDLPKLTGILHAHAKLFSNETYVHSVTVVSTRTGRRQDLENFWCGCRFNVESYFSGQHASESLSNRSTSPIPLRPAATCCRSRLRKLRPTR